MSTPTHPTAGADAGNPAVGETSDHSTGAGPASDSPLVQEMKRLLNRPNLFPETIELIEGAIASQRMADATAARGAEDVPTYELALELLELSREAIRTKDKFLYHGIVEIKLPLFLKAISEDRLKMEDERQLNPTSAELFAAIRAKGIHELVVRAECEGTNEFALYGGVDGSPVYHSDKWSEVLEFLGLYTPPAAQPAEQS